MPQADIDVAAPAQLVLRSGNTGPSSTASVAGSGDTGPQRVNPQASRVAPRQAYDRGGKEVSKLDS